MHVIVEKILYPIQTQSSIASLKRLLRSALHGNYLFWEVIWHFALLIYKYLLNIYRKLSVVVFNNNRTIYSSIDIVNSIVLEH